MSAPIPKVVRVHRFHPDRLDRIIVQCYAQAWTAYWGAHGDCPVEHFVATCDADYVASNLDWGNEGQRTKAAQKRHTEYLTRIVRAIQEEFSKAGQRRPAKEKTA
jgi:hypothetical protein